MKKSANLIALLLVMLATALSSCSKGAGDTIDQIVKEENDPAVVAEIKQMGFSDYKALRRGNDIVYIYTFARGTADFSKVTSADKRALQTAAQVQAAKWFNGLAPEVQEALEQAGTRIIYEYYDPNGEVISVAAPLLGDPKPDTLGIPIVGVD